MATQEVAIRQTVNITLKSDTEMLDDVVVVAYGTAKKSSFTGSATAVSGEKKKKMQVSSVSKALEGAAAGVQVINTSGQPGENAKIRIRGIGSFMDLPIRLLPYMTRNWGVVLKRALRNLFKESCLSINWLNFICVSFIL